MKKSDYSKELVQYILKKDQHLALNKVQTEQLVKYIVQYNDKVRMIPPNQYACTNEFRFEWESEDD